MFSSNPFISEPLARRKSQVAADVAAREAAEEDAAVGGQDVELTPTVHSVVDIESDIESPGPRGTMRV